MISSLITLLFLSETVGETCKCVCEGETNKTSWEKYMEGFIVGGEFATKHQFPHSVAMLVFPIETFFCGASVLNQKVILTAAHCVPTKLFRKYVIYVLAGHEDIEQMEIARVVKKYIYHSQYNSVSVENDIALLFLEEDLPLGANIKRVAITSQFPLAVHAADVAGWGNINDTTEERSLILKFVSQPIIPLEVCKTKYRSDWEPGMMCAGTPNSHSNVPSKGDSGSALVASGYHQIGLVSYRIANIPGLVFYTNISYFYEWIVTTTMNQVCDDFTAPIVIYNSTDMLLNHTNSADDSTAPVSDETKSSNSTTKL